MIDLSSDTATRPTEAMRAFMASAPVGDDQRREDPTVNALESEAVRLLGKPAALFLPSATMANQIAIRLHTRPGDELLCHESAHIRKYEGGGPAALSGVTVHPIVGPRGLITATQLRLAVKPDDPHFPRTRLVCVENTHNYMGGCVWKRKRTLELAEAARSLGLALHLDGSRLMNASVAQGVSAADLAAPFDTVTLCLSKGLGAPVGAILAGSVEAMREGRRYKHLFGGAMRQAGIIAAGGLYAIRHHIDRLADDHKNAFNLAMGFLDIEGIYLDPFPETNLVFASLINTSLTRQEFLARLEAEGVRASSSGDNRIRFVTHLDISADDIKRTLAAVRHVLKR